jgi:flagellar protein FlaF
MRSAAQAYGKIANKVASPRELESDLLLTAASRLQAVRDDWNNKKSQLDEALLYNRQLWMIFIDSITSADHPLPAAIRQNVANLGVFVINQTVSMMTNPKPDQLTPLININRELASGLRGSA